MPDVGLCTAYADGHVRIVFCDGVLLELDSAGVWANVTTTDGQTMRVTTAMPVRVERYCWLQEEVQLVDLLSPRSMLCCVSHVRIAVEFQQWAAMSPEQRQALAVAEQQRQRELEQLTERAETVLGLYRATHAQQRTSNERSELSA